MRNYMCTAVALLSFTMGQISNLTKIHTTFEDQSRHKNVNFLAVFLLSHLGGSKFFNSINESKPVPEFDYFERVKAAKLTFGISIRNFYAVIGNSTEHDTILSNTKYCTNRTTSYLNHIIRGSINYLDSALPREHVYECQGIRVLHAHSCSSSSWGHDGPCCRCSAAMRFYLDMFASSPTYPNWFLFADDDYFVRTFKLEGYLSQLDPRRAYAVGAPPQFPATAGPDGKGGTRQVWRETELGTDRGGNSNCSVPCSHVNQWLGFTVMSYGAMAKMEEAIRSDQLVNVCLTWHLSHDGGLGVMVYEHGISRIGMCCGADGSFYGRNFQEGVYYHKIGIRSPGEVGNVPVHNDFLHMIWEYMVQKQGLNLNDTKPNWNEYMEFEFNEGVQLYRKNPPYPNAEFENSLFFRKMLFSELMHHQLHENQVKELGLNPLKRTDFTPQDCTAEMEFHIEWRRKHLDKYPLYNLTEDQSLNYANRLRNRVWSNIPMKGYDINHPKMCAEYFVHVMNSPVRIEDLQLPPLDDLYRRRRLRTLLT